MCLTAIPECTIAPVSGKRAQRGHQGLVQRFQAAYGLRAQGSAKVGGDEEEAWANQLAPTIASERNNKFCPN